MAENDSGTKNPFYPKGNPVRAPELPDLDGGPSSTQKPSHGAEQAAEVQRQVKETIKGNPFNTGEAGTPGGRR